MSWSDHHGESERLASEAEALARRGDKEGARRLYGQAASAECRALTFVGADKPRTLGITAVSAAALWYHAGDLKEAARVAHAASTLAGLPAFATAELRTLLQAIWNETAQQEAGLTFVPGQVLVSVKGGQVIHGGAPLDLIVEKVQNVQSLFYRIAEYLKGLPLRKKGPPIKEIQEREEGMSDEPRTYTISDGHWTGISCSCCNGARAKRVKKPKAKPAPAESK